MTFSEFAKKECRNISDYGILEDIDLLLAEYNAYLSEQQNQPITSEFLLGLGFEKILYFTKSNNTFEILIDLHEQSISITDYSSETILPFPKTQKDVLDLMRLLEL